LSDAVGVRCVSCNFGHGLVLHDCDEPLARCIRSDRIKTSSKSSMCRFAVRVNKKFPFLANPFFDWDFPSSYALL